MGSYFMRTILCSVKLPGNKCEILSQKGPYYVAVVSFNQHITLKIIFFIIPIHQGKQYLRSHSFIVRTNACPQKWAKCLPKDNFFQGVICSVFYKLFEFFKFSDKTLKNVRWPTGTYKDTFTYMLLLLFYLLLLQKWLS